MVSLTNYELLDNCINMSHYNISLYIYDKLKNKYRYNNKQWYLVDNDKDNQEIKLKEEILVLFAEKKGKYI